MAVEHVRGLKRELAEEQAAQVVEWVRKMSMEDYAKLRAQLLAGDFTGWPGYPKPL